MRRIAIRPCHFWANYGLPIRINPVYTENNENRVLIFGRIAIRPCIRRKMDPLPNWLDCW